MNMRSSLILGIIIASLASIVTVIIIIIPSIYKEDIVSKYGCSTTLGIDKPSSIRWPEGLYASGSGLPIKVYYCDVKGFADIRFVTRNNFGFNEYEFVMRPGSTATITLLLDVSKLRIEDLDTGKVYTGVKAMIRPEKPPAFYLLSDTYPEGFYFYPSSVQILSNEYVLVTYTAEADKDIIKRTTVGTVLGLNVYPILIFSADNEFYISIIRD
jgi:hypothetical protein